MYPAPHMATVANPAAAAESPPGSLYGLYRGDENLLYGSINLGMKMFGVSAAYRQEGVSENKVDIYEGSLGISSGILMVGGTFRSVESDDEDGDVSFMVDLDVLRFGVVARDISGGTDRLDFGLGFRMSDRYYFEVDLKKYEPFERKEYLADVSFVVNEHDWTIGVGYDTEYRNEELQEGHIHAGFALKILESAFLDLHYRLMTQEWSGDHWNGGFRLIW
jgi:hypothetical protein